MDCAVSLFLLDMAMAVDPAWHDQKTGRIDLFMSLEIGTDLNDF